MGENEKMVVYNFRVDEKLIFEFKKIALEERKPLNKLITEVMKEFLEKHANGA